MKEKSRDGSSSDLEVSSSQSNSGFVFSPHTLSPIAALKATLGLDIYGAGSSADGK
jgi:hypothetical protein